MIKLFCIYNKTLKQFYSPNIMDYQTENVKRNMFDVVNDSKENYIKLAPANYAVYEIGEFDSQTGKLNAYKKPILVVECAELVQKENADG